MVETILKDLTENKDFQQLLTKYASKTLQEHILSRFNPENEKRKLTQIEKGIIALSVNKKKIPPFEEFNKLNADINTFILPLGERIWTLFTLLEKSLDDDEMCETIDLLSQNGYNLNERTLYNGGNTLLSCVLSVKPKSALKLLKLGVNPNVTNQTLNTVYEDIKRFIENIDTDIYTKILETRNLLDKKEELISQYKQLLEYIEQNNIPKEVNDDFYQEIDDYIKIIVTENSLNKEEAHMLKESIYQLAINIINQISIDVCEKHNL